MATEVIFSVVIPHYCAPELLNLALNSVGKQTLKPHQIIVVDDCSPGNRGPGNLSVVGDVEIISLVTEKNFGGPAGPRNFGARHCTGEYIAFLDADDVWAEDHLETLAGAIRSLNCDLVGCTIRNFRKSGDYPSLRKRKGYRTVGEKEVTNKNPFATSATAVKREIFNQYLFDEDVAFHAVEDWDLWQRLIIGGNLAVKMETETTWYRISIGGISANKYKHLKKIYKVLAKNIRLANNSRSACYSRLTVIWRFTLYCIASFYLRVLRGRL